MEVAEFDCVIPLLAGAIKISGEGVARITLETDASQLAEIVKLTAFGRDVLLHVKVEA